MKFKYNFLAGMLLAGMAVSCDPLDDIYAELDAEQDIVVKTIEEYILTSEDYATISSLAVKDAGDDKGKKKMAEAVAKEQALNSFAQPSVYIPKILADKFFSWGKGSSAGVTYRYHEEADEKITSLQTVKDAFLSNDDYDAVWAADDMSGVNYLSPKHQPQEVIPAVLAQKFADAQEGDFAAVDYRYADADPIMEAGEDLYAQDFSGIEPSSKEEKKPVVIEGWEQIQIEGERTWEGKKYGDNLYAQMSAHRAKGNEVVAMVTSPVEITNSAATLTFDLKYGYYKGDCFTVFVSDKYAGNGTFDAAEWTDLTASYTFPEGIADGYTEMVNCGNASLAAFNGKTVRFAFVYTGAGNGVTTTVQLDNIKVTSKKVVLGKSEKFNALYRFDGNAWKENKDKDIFLITPQEYDSMGEPGSHDNFSASCKPEDYLPVFLSQKYPYAKQGSCKYIVYKFYSGKAATLNAVQYELGTSWTESTNIVMHEKKSYFRNDQVWFLDPTTRIEFVKDDYVYLVNWVKNNGELEGYYDTKYGNAEYWFGASYFKNNFDFRLNKRQQNDPKQVIPADETEATKYFVKMAAEGIKLVLANRYPDRPAQENGADIYYLVTVRVYDAANWIYVYKFKGLGDGKFEVEGEPEVTKL